MTVPVLEFRNLSKSYGSTEVIHDVNAVVADREFLVLLGPSGCGKSTILRMIAGLAEVSDGEVLFDGASVNGMDPRRRNVAFVFQSYALYPHLNVRANISFPLVMDRFRWWYHIPILNTIQRRLLARSHDIVSTVERVAETLELTDYLDRKPRDLSGGQRQRVALARALVRDPTIYLLDEPLSNLDAKLRTQMRAEIAELHRRVQKSFVYVTHDQVEAMTMGTQIIVLDRGRVQQSGTPEDIYHRPANTFVARFIGSPPMNLVPVTVTEDRRVMLGQSEIVSGAVPEGSGDRLLGVRSEDVLVVSGDEARPGDLAASVDLVEHLGAETIVGFTLLGDPSETRCRVRVDGLVRHEPGSPVMVRFPAAKLHWFDPATGSRLPA